jgi:pimeloyl-ACP methyl ester carboxylesterase
MALGDANDAILVGHSLGGLTIPLIATDRPVRRLVYLCAGVPLPGLSWFDQETTNPALATAESFVPVLHDDGTSSWTEHSATQAFYHDCDPHTQKWAVARLRRQAWLPFIEPTPLTEQPDVPSSVIIGRDDRILPRAYTQQTAHHLGVAAVVLDGGHLPLLARPAQLARELDKLASL